MNALPQVFERRASAAAFRPPMQQMTTLLRVLAIASTTALVSGCATTERAVLHLGSGLENESSQASLAFRLRNEPANVVISEPIGACVRCRREGAGSVLVWRWATVGRHVRIDDEWGFMLSISFPRNDIAGVWDLGDDSADRPIAIYTQGPTPNESHARCFGYATAGTLRVSAVGERRWIADADLKIRFVERPESSSQCTAGRLRRTVAVSVSD
jgi:hypothetical protein